MTKKVNLLHEIDDLLFNTKRLIILSLLLATGPQTQGNLRKKGNLTWGEVSAHLKRLEKGNYISQKDVISREGPRVLVEITEEGINAYNDTLVQLREFIKEPRDT